MLLLILVLQVAVILATCRGVAALFRRMGQPSVVGEMFAGILLGPSILGALAPRLEAFLFPASSLSNLNALSQIGLIIFMFLVGLEMNPNELKSHAHATLLTISPAFRQQCFLHQLQPFYGRGHEHHGIPGAGSHPERAQYAARPPWNRGHCLRRGG